MLLSEVDDTAPETTSIPKITLPENTADSLLSRAESRFSCWVSSALLLSESIPSLSDLPGTWSPCRPSTYSC